MKMAAFNLFKPEHFSGEQERFETLLQQHNVTIERILSPGGLRSRTFIQSQDEWVCLLQGEAQLEMDERKLQLKAGETLFIPAGTPHRVLNTSHRPTCIWLTVHIHPQP
jgi:cupin 2 domain-containing protein